MLDREVIGDTLGLGIGESRFNNVLGVLDLRGKRVQVVLSIKVKVDAMVAKGLHICLTTRGSVTLRKRWSHICRVKSEDISKSTLILAHLRLAHV